MSLGVGARVRSRSAQRRSGRSRRSAESPSSSRKRMTPPRPSTLKFGECEGTTAIPPIANRLAASRGRSPSAIADLVIGRSIRGFTQGRVISHTSSSAAAESLACANVRTADGSCESLAVQAGQDDGHHIVSGVAPAMPATDSQLWYRPANESLAHRPVSPRDARPYLCGGKGLWKSRRQLSGRASLRWTVEDPSVSRRVRWTRCTDGCIRVPPAFVGLTRSDSSVTKIRIKKMPLRW